MDVGIRTALTIACSWSLMPCILFAPPIPPMGGVIPGKLMLDFEGSIGVDTIECCNVCADVLPLEFSQGKKKRTSLNGNQVAGYR